MTILKKLLEIQQAVNKFVQDGKGNNYKYTTGNTVLGTIRPLMNEKGLILIQEVTDIHNVRMDYSTRSNPNKSEILTTVKMLFTWVDCETGEKLPCQFAANGQNDWDKGFGSALTYGERYFLLKFFHVQTDEDDPDALKKEPAAAPQQTPAKPWLNKFDGKGNPTKEYINALQGMKQGKTIADIRQYYSVSKETAVQLETDNAA